MVRLLNIYSMPLTPPSYLGWFARDPVLLSRVGRALLQIPDAHPVRPVQLIIAEDCFQLSSIPTDRVKQVLVHSVEKLFGGKQIGRLIYLKYSYIHLAHTF